jgi:hypothetical protein
MPVLVEHGGSVDGPGTQEHDRLARLPLQREIEAALDLFREFSTVAQPPTGKQDGVVARRHQPHISFFCTFRISPRMMRSVAEPKG